MREFQPSKVRAILFDIDGTLADSDDVWVEKLTRWLVPLKRIWPRLRPDHAARRLVMGVEGPMNLAYVWWDRLFLDEVTSPLSRLLARSPRPDAAPARLIPGVRDMLEVLRSSYSLAVVTARGRGHTERFLRSTQLDGVFDAVITSRSARRAKPHPAPILLAAEVLGVEVGGCLMVGDTTLDVRAGLAAGAQTAAVLCGFGTEAELADSAPHLLLRSTAELSARLQPQATS
jgi:phosphoglycolate phosphatase